MSNLLIDIGNSDVKVGTGSKHIKDIKLIKRFSYKKDNFEIDLENNLIKIISLPNIDKIGISILNENKNTFLKRIFTQNPVFINRRSKLPVTIDYSEGIGNDRICSAAGASGSYSNKNILIIDFGTATTYTLVSNRVLKGGMISPGIKTCLQSLIEKASLPDVKLTFPKELLNRNTIDNIRAGILYPGLYTAERVIVETKKKYRGLFVVATGGFAELIYKRTNLINKYDENLVLKGINIIISQ